MPARWPAVRDRAWYTLLRARAIEAERSRISRDLHDGILQTLLSIEIQLDVLRRQSDNLYERVRALFFLYAIHRFHLPNKPGVGQRGLDARIVASTSANMEALISQGSFRSDLYHRLNTFTITLPPLRDRPRDIPLVADRILARFTRQFGYEVSLSPEGMDVLKKYPWPGNIREMEAVLGRAATQVAGTGVIGLEQLPANVRRMEALPQMVEPFLQVNSLAEMEREAIFLTMQMQRGNVSRMARSDTSIAPRSSPLNGWL